jgi:hypothetical protein
VGEEVAAREALALSESGSRRKHAAREMQFLSAADRVLAVLPICPARDHGRAIR